MQEDAFTPLEPLDELDPATAPPVDVDRMLTQLRSWDPSLRMQAARAFCDLEDSRAVSPLVDLLTDPCPLVRVSATYALGRNPDPSVVEPLMAILQHEWNGYVRKGAVWALGNARDRRALPVLREALAHDITAVRLWAASALGQLTHGLDPTQLIQAVCDPLLQALVHDPSPVVRSNCAWSLGKVGQVLQIQGGHEDRLIQTLIHALQTDPDVGVQDDARLALEKLGDPDGLAAIETLDLG